MIQHLMLLLAALPLSDTASRPSDAEPHGRWAIIASPEVEATGLVDLLTASLSQQPDLQVVERMEIAAITRELEISEALGAHGTQARLKLGRLLNADALVMLSEETHAFLSLSDAVATRPESETGIDPAVASRPAPLETRRSLRVIVAECRHGARLRVESFLLQDDNTVEVVAAVTELVSRTRQHYAAGVRSIVAVAPFVSRTLTHEYDYLQSSLAIILQNALSVYPGVAVVEMEEAQAIQTELALSASPGVDRVVPVLVEGEFRIEASNADDGPRISLSVRFDEGRSAPQVLARSGLTLGQAADLLRQEGQRWGRNLSAAAADARFSVDDQVTFMLARAAAFSDLGDYEHSAGLREACLLLKPRLNDTRIRTVEEYTVLLAICAREASNPGYDPKTESAWLPHYVERWRLCLEHLEAIIYDPQGPHARVCELMSVWARTHERIYRLSEAGRQDLARVGEMQRRFLLGVYPRLLPLVSPVAWQNAFVELVTRTEDVWSPSPEKGILDLITRALVDLIPPEDELSFSFISFVDHRFLYSSHFRGTSGPAVAMRDFLTGLVSSGIPRNAILARYGLLRYELGMIELACAAPGEGVRAAVDDLLRDAQDCRIEGLVASVERLQTRIRGATARQTTTTQHQGTGQVAKKPVTSGPADPADAVHVPATRVRMTLRDRRGNQQQLAGRTWPGPYYVSHPALSFLGCGLQIDVFWNETVVLHHVTPGLLQAILVEPDGDLDDVAWDGERLWAATLHHGIKLLNLKGEVERVIGREEGLPPSDQGLKLCAIEPGKVVAAGSFGQHHRAWCAVISLAVPTPQVRVFHEATKVAWTPRLSPSSRYSEDEALQLAFVPTAVAPLLEASQHPGHLLIVGTSGEHEAPGRIDSSPLSGPRIDTRSWSVSRPQEEDVSSLDGCVLPDGHVLTRWGCLSLAPGWRFLDGSSSRQLCRSGSGYDWSRSQAFQTRLVPYQGYVYLPGRTWYRFNPLTLKVEPLVLDVREEGGLHDPDLINRGFSSHPQLFERAVRINCAASAHLGLIEWNERNEFFRLDVPPGPPSPPIKPPVIYAGKGAVTTRPSLARDRDHLQPAIHPSKPPDNRPWTKRVRGQIEGALDVGLALVPTLGLGLIVAGWLRRPKKRGHSCPRCGERLPDTLLLRCPRCDGRLDAVSSGRRRPRAQALQIGCGLALLAVGAWGVAHQLRPASIEVNSRELSPELDEIYGHTEMDQLARQLAEPSQQLATLQHVLNRIRQESLSRADIEQITPSIQKLFSGEYPALKPQQQAGLDVLGELLCRQAFTPQEEESVLDLMDGAPVICWYQSEANRLFLRGDNRSPGPTAAHGLIREWTISAPSLGTGVEYRLPLRHSVDQWQFSGSLPGESFDNRDTITLQLTTTWYAFGPGFPQDQFERLSNEERSALLRQVAATQDPRVLRRRTREVVLRRSGYVQTLFGTHYWPAVVVAQRDESPGATQPEGGRSLTCGVRPSGEARFERTLPCSR